MDRAEIVKLQRPVLEGQPIATLRNLGVPVDQWEAREQAERQFEALLREYIKNPIVKGLPKYRFGGMVNLCNTLKKVCDDFAQEAHEARQVGESDWEFASGEFRELETILNLKYSTEVRGRDWDAGADLDD